MSCKKACLASIFQLNDCECITDSIQFIHGKDSVDCVLICGPKSYKTSLLMQVAISEARQEKQVLFVSPHRLSKLPPTVHGMDQPSSEVMRNIQFLYAKDKSELQSYFSSVHLSPASDQPAVIMVDELNYYCSCSHDDSELTTFCKLTSLINNAGTFAKDREETSGKASFVMAWNVREQDSAPKLTEVEEVAQKLHYRVWTTGKESESSSRSGFKISTRSARGTLSVAYSFKVLDQTFKGLLLEEISMKTLAFE